MKIKNKAKLSYYRHFKPSIYKKIILENYNKEIVHDYSKTDLTSYSPTFDYEKFETKNLLNHTDDTKKTIIWFVPEWSNVWGGGHLTIFKFANFFEKNGLKNLIYIYNGSSRRPLDIEKELRYALNGTNVNVITDPKLIPYCDAAIATTWQSAYYVKSFSNCREKFYFMQDYESQFYSYGTSSIQAENTYTFGFKGITGGGWLKEIYESFGNKDVINYNFSTDKKIFYPNSNKISNQNFKVFFYGRPSTPRRCFELGIESLKLIYQKFKDVEINIAGLKIEKVDFGFNCNLLGNLTLVQTGELYRKCDVGIAFSGTNLSYLPVELMASGCPVITNKGKNSEWYCNTNNSVLVDPTPSSVLNGFEKLYYDKDYRAKIIQNGLTTSNETSWENEMEKILEFIKKFI